MISDLSLFQVYSAMARHAAESQRVSATNIARADEPGYKAVEVESFEDFLARVKAEPDAARSLSGAFRTFESNAPISPSGNSVSLEQQVFKSAEAMGQHNLALSVYTKSLDLLRAAIGRR